MYIKSKMPLLTNTANPHDAYDYIALLMRSLVPSVVGLVLLIGGVWLLTLPLPGWKLILGIPAAQMGIVVLMYAFDDITKKRLHPDHLQSLICPFCSFNNLIQPGTKTIHCGRCMKKITRPNELNNDE